MNDRTTEPRQHAHPVEQDQIGYKIKQFPRRVFHAARRHARAIGVTAVLVTGGAAAEGVINNTTGVNLPPFGEAAGQTLNNVSQAVQDADKQQAAEQTKYNQQIQAEKDKFFNHLHESPTYFNQGGLMELSLKRIAEIGITDEAIARRNLGEYNPQLPDIANATNANGDPIISGGSTLVLGDFVETQVDGKFILQVGNFTIDGKTYYVFIPADRLTQSDVKRMGSWKPMSETPDGGIGTLTVKNSQPEPQPQSQVAQPITS